MLVSCYHFGAVNFEISLIFLGQFPSDHRTVRFVASACLFRSVVVQLYRLRYIYTSDSFVEQVFVFVSSCVT